MGIFDQTGNGEETKYIPAPAGMHPARLVSVVDLGSHDSTWEGETRTNRLFHLAWELVGTDSGGGKPFIVSKSYKVARGNFGYYFNKTGGMFKLLKNWLGLSDKEAARIPSVRSAIGKAALVQVSHAQKGDRTYANVTNVSPVMSIGGVPVPVEPAVTPSLLWSIDGGNTDDLPAFLAKRAKECYELQGKTVPSREVQNAANTDTEDVPF